MSTTTKSIITLVIIAAAGAAIWWSGWLTNIGISFPQAQNTATTTPEQQEQQMPNDLPTAADNTSDQALQQDVAALDAQISATAGDMEQVDEGLADEPVEQEY